MTNEIHKKDHVYSHNEYLPKKSTGLSQHNL